MNNFSIYKIVSILIVGIIILLNTIDTAAQINLPYIVNPYYCPDKDHLPDACYRRPYQITLEFGGGINADHWTVDARGTALGLHFESLNSPKLIGPIKTSAPTGDQKFTVSVTIDGFTVNKEFSIFINTGCSYPVVAGPCKWDIAFVIDASKSMTYPAGAAGTSMKWDKILEYFSANNYIKQMATVAGLGADDNWGLFFFGDNSVIHDPVHHRGHFAGLLDTAFWPHALVGNTPFGGGLQLALQRFFHNRSNPDGLGRGQAVVILTDGLQNRNPRVDVTPMTKNFSIRQDLTWEPGSAIVFDRSTNVSGGLGDTLPISKEVFARNQIKVYSIGIGSGINSATGSDLDRMSDKFVNSEDQTQLLRFFNYIIPQIFKGHSPRIVNIINDTMPGSLSTKTQTFVLNDSLKNLVIHIAAVDSSFSSVQATLQKDGVSIIPETVIANDRVTLYLVDFPATVAPGATPLTSKGTWTLTYHNNTDSVLCTTTLFADDEYLKYSIDFKDQTSFFTGDDLPVRIQIQYNEMPVTDAVVEAYLVRPRNDLGDTVSNAAVQLLTLLQDTLDLSMGQAKYAVLESQAGFHAYSEQELQDTLALHQTSAGVYEGHYTNTSVVGAYRVVARISGTDPTGGAYEGWEMASTYVDFAHPEDIDLNPEITPADDNPGPAGDTPGGAPAADADRTTPDADGATPPALRMVASPEKADTSGAPNPKLDPKQSTGDPLQTLDPKIDPPKSPDDTAKGTANTDVLFTKTLKGNQTFRLKITPTNRFGNKLGPAQEDRIFVRLSKGKVGAIHDNLDGSYTTTLLVPARTNPMVQIGVIDPRHPIVEKCLYCFRSRFGLSAHPGVTIPMARLDSLYGPSASVELNLSYEFNARLALEAVGGMYVFNPSFGILGASLFGVIKKTDFPGPGWDIRAAAGAGVFRPSGEAGTIGYSMRASLTRRYNLHSEIGLQLGYFNLPKPKYSFETIGLVWHYFF